MTRQEETFQASRYVRDRDAQQRRLNDPVKNTGLLPSEKPFPGVLNLPGNAKRPRQTYADAVSNPRPSTFQKAQRPRRDQRPARREQSTVRREQSTARRAPLPTRREQQQPARRAQPWTQNNKRDRSRGRKGEDRRPSTNNQQREQDRYRQIDLFLDSFRKMIEK